MDPIDVTAYVLHSVVAGLWTGSVLFVTRSILPLAKEGSLNAAPLESVAATLTRISRASALVLVVTGAYMGVARSYTVESLTGTTGGYLVIAMVVLWFLLAGVVEAGTSKLADGAGQNKVREPARESRPFLLAGSLLALGLLVTAGAIAAHNVGAL